MGLSKPYPPPGDLPDPWIEFASLMSPVLTGWFFTTSATWEAPNKLLESAILSEISQTEKEK